MTSLSVVATTTYGTSSGAAAGLGITFGLIGAIIGFAITGLLLMGIFTKAGRPAWEAFVPFYNYWILITQIIGRPAWWFWVMILCSWIPVVNIVSLVLGIIAMNDLAKSFGKDSAYTVGLVLLSIVFLPILSYGQARYLGKGALMGPVAYGQQQYWGPAAAAPAAGVRVRAAAPGSVRPAASPAVWPAGVRPAAPGSVRPAAAAAQPVRPAQPLRPAGPGRPEAAVAGPRLSTSLRRNSGGHVLEVT